MSKFVIYIDESGESGVSKVRSGKTPGASPYFVLGAAVFQPAAQISARQQLQEYKDLIGKQKWKHATELGHHEKLYLARLIGQMQVRLFGVISNKATLSDYKGQIESDSQKFYNKCLKYLLEIVLRYLQKYNVGEDDISVVLEERNHDYDAMLRYFQSVKDKPIYEQSKVLKGFNPYCISRRKKGEEDLLEYADFVAHALYQLTNRSDQNYQIPEYRYFWEMSSRFAGDSKMNVLGTGLKCIHTLEQLALDMDVAQVLAKAKSRAPNASG